MIWSSPPTFWMLSLKISLPGKATPLTMNHSMLRILRWVRHTYCALFLLLINIWYSQVQSFSDRPGYERTSSSLWKQREEHCAKIIQTAWRDHYNKVI